MTAQQIVAEIDTLADAKYSIPRMSFDHFCSLFFLFGNYFNSLN